MWVYSKKLVIWKFPLRFWNFVWNRMTSLISTTEKNWLILILYSHAMDLLKCILTIGICWARRKFAKSFHLDFHVWIRPFAPTVQRELPSSNFSQSGYQDLISIIVHFVISLIDNVGLWTVGTIKIKGIYPDLYPLSCVKNSHSAGLNMAKLLLSLWHISRANK